VVDREDYETRMQRLRAQTQTVPLPPGLLTRVMARAQDDAREPSLWELLSSVGRWALVPAACAPVAVGIALVLAGGWLDEAVFVASSVGWVP